MSHSGSSASLARRQDDAGGGSTDEPPRKQPKLDLHAGKCEAPVANVKIDDLPDKLMITILSFLSYSELQAVAENVCSRWRRLSHNTDLHRNMKYCIEYDKTDAIVRRDLTRWPEVCHVVMRRSVQPSVFPALCSCSHLETLEFCCWQNVKQPLLKELVQHCHRIQSLTIPVGCLLDVQKANVLAQLHMLKSLRVLSSEYSQRNIHLRPILDGCHQLANMKFSDCVGVAIDDLEYLISVRCRTLTHLKLPRVSNMTRCVVPQLKECTSLIYLKLHNLWKCKDSMLKEFTVLGQLSNLRSLMLNSLWHCPAVASANIFRSGHFPHLQVLQISHHYLQDNVVVAICNLCPELKELQLGGCLKLTNKAFSELYRLCKLETFILKSCKDLGEGTITCVAQVPKIRKLLIESCDLRKQHAGLECILDMSTLEILSLANTRYICYVPFDRIAEKLVKLRILNVQSCELDKGVLEQLKEQMPSLEIHYNIYSEINSDSDNLDE